MQLHEGSHSLLTLHVFQLTWISGIVNFSIFFVLTVRSMGLSLVVVRMVRLSALIWGKGLLLAELIFQLFLLKIMIRYQFISLIASNTLMFFFWQLGLKFETAGGHIFAIWWRSRIPYGSREQYRKGRVCHYVISCLISPFQCPALNLCK